jgi:hypothetical protein
MAEPEDDGFSERVIRAAQDQNRYPNRADQLARLRFGFLMGGCFMGGILTATQLKPAWGFFANTPLPTGPIWLITLFTLFIFAVWATLDIRDAGTL